MALVLADRVREGTNTAGTGTVTLTGAVTGFASFASQIGNGNTTYYTITDGTNWEVGVGTYNANTLSRDTLIDSSTGSLVNFAAGFKDVFVTLPGAKTVSTDTLATPPAIGGTTPAAGTFTTLIGGGGSANYFQIEGAATTKAVEAKALGSDTNIAFVIDSKGTGAIDLAAGSSGVNISNGGTVTAINGTSAGSGYTSFPTPAVSAPTTSGGVQAVVAVVRMFNSGATVQTGGTGYTVNDVLTVTGGTPLSSATTLTVTSVSGGVITGISATSQSTYTALPTNPVSVTGGTGSGATFNLTWGVVTGATGYSITTAGSGYVEQPTVTFSGGGGSGAAAYATVGSGTVVKSIGSTMLFQTPGGTAFGVTDIANSVNYIRNQGSSSGFQVFSTVQGADTNTSYAITSKGNGAVSLYTNLGNQLQFTVAHTASAVNYVQVTGAATGGQAKVSSQGSDTNVGLGLSMKGWQNISFYSGNFGYEIFRNAQNTGTPANFLSSMAVAAGSSPAFQAIGSDTNIDLTLTPKGTGNVRFGTYTASVLTPTGYIEIKDSGGTIRRLLVG
jgi:hypothetical protein